MSAIIFTDRDELAAFLRDTNAMHGLPRRGDHRGLGRHVNLDDPSQPGWSLRFASPVKNGAEWAIKLSSGDLESLRDSTKLARIRADRQATILAHEARAAELPEGAGWEEAKDDAVSPAP